MQLGEATATTTRCALGKFWVARFSGAITPRLTGVAVESRRRVREVEVRGRSRPGAACGSSPRVHLDRPRCPSCICGELSARPSPLPLGHCQRRPAEVWVARLGPSRANAAPAGPGLMGRSAGSGRSRPFLSRPSRFAQPSPPHKNQRRRGGRAPCAKRTAALALPKWEYETHRHEAPQRRRGALLTADAGRISRALWRGGCA